jgi:acetyltransferase-like isoleucine patch superfamily enzyme
MNPEHAFHNGILFSKPIKRKNTLIRRFVKRIGNNFFVLKKDQIDVWSPFLTFSDISDSSLLGPDARCLSYGKKNRIYIEEGAVIRGTLRCESFGDGQILIGRNVYVGDDVLISCSAGVKLGDNTLIAHGVQIFDNNTHPVKFEERHNDWVYILKGLGEKPRIDSRNIVIGQSCWIGFNSIILKGVTIGDHTIVSAGSVVTTDIPANVIAGGNPARVIKELN